MGVFPNNLCALWCLKRAYEYIPKGVPWGGSSGKLGLWPRDVGHLVQVQSESELRLTVSQAWLVLSECWTDGEPTFSLKLDNWNIVFCLLYLGEVPL